MSNDNASTGFEAAVAAIVAGKAESRSLWILMSKESDRDGHALRPIKWEGPGEYQHVTYSDGRDGLVRIPDGEFSLSDRVKHEVRLRSFVEKAEGR